MTEWSLKTLLQSLHDEIEAKLGIARGSFGHGLEHLSIPGTATEIAAKTKTNIRLVGLGDFPDHRVGGNDQPGCAVAALDGSPVSE